MTRYSILLLVALFVLQAVTSDKHQGKHGKEAKEESIAEDVLINMVDKKVEADAKHLRDKQDMDDDFDLEDDDDDDDDDNLTAENLVHEFMASDVPLPDEDDAPLPDENDISERKWRPLKWRRNDYWRWATKLKQRICRRWYRGWWDPVCDGVNQKKVYKCEKTQRWCCAPCRMKAKCARYGGSCETSYGCPKGNTFVRRGCQGKWGCCIAPPVLPP